MTSLTPRYYLLYSLNVLSRYFFAKCWVAWPHVLHLTVLLLTESQQTKTGTDCCVWVNLDVPKLARLPFQTLPSPLKVETQRHCRFSWDVVAFCTLYIRALYSPEEGTTNGCGCFVWLDAHNGPALLGPSFCGGAVRKLGQCLALPVFWCLLGRVQLDSLRCRSTFFGFVERSTSIRSGPLVSLSPSRFAPVPLSWTPMGC